MNIWQNKTTESTESPKYKYLQLNPLVDSKTDSLATYCYNKNTTHWSWGI